MDSRRDFLKQVALLAAGTGMLPASIQKAFAINPEPGSTFLDAEHVVILMQENRSFDHAYGTLRGVRGFNDPRAMTLPDGNPVWLQTNEKGETYAPFRLNLRDTKSTWMGSLPHSRESETAARHGGRHDHWLIANPSGEKEYAHLPLTLGFYNRDDLPFYYALADAFTICDQNFCSALTCTTPNRLYLWSGTVREKPDISAHAILANENADHDSPVGWKTFPERLEEAGVSWRVYQNEIYLPTGFDHPTEAWLSNYGDNPLEYVTQYNVRYSGSYRRHLSGQAEKLTTELAALEKQIPATPQSEGQIKIKRDKLKSLQGELEKWSAENFAKLPSHAKNLHRNAFTINSGDPHHRDLDSLQYQENGVEHQMKAPKGDVLHQFREDVRTGKLPTVSWLVAPENFSDHPSAPWYGAWYLSEAFDILTQNPEVWKKTIFILCYDENDGYFDHIPPFMPPHPGQPDTGKVSANIDTSVEMESLEQQRRYKSRHPNAAHGPDPIGLGYRVPLLIASPWSRGGCVCSQVFDHTSILQFLEQFLSAKTGRAIRETNISDWRRAVCGDLTSVFQPYRGEKIEPPKPVARIPFLRQIDQARFKPVPDDFKQLSAEEIAQARQHPLTSPVLPQQETGIRPSCALPYELAADGQVDADQKKFTLRLAAGKNLFGAKSAGSPFFVYAPGKFKTAGANAFESGHNRQYTVSAGDALTDTWPLANFEHGLYHLRAHGPNGFYREFRGTIDDPRLEVTLQPVLGADHAILHLLNRDAQHPLTVLVNSHSYEKWQRQVKLSPFQKKKHMAEVRLELGRSFGWYDLQIRVESSPEFARRYAGRIENGRQSFSDPLMGRVSKPATF